MQLYCFIRPLPDAKEVSQVPTLAKSNANGQLFCISHQNRTFLFPSLEIERSAEVLSGEFELIFAASDNSLQPYVSHFKVVSDDENIAALSRHKDHEDGLRTQLTEYQDLCARKSTLEREIMSLRWRIRSAVQDSQLTPQLAPFSFLPLEEELLARKKQVHR